MTGDVSDSKQKDVTDGDNSQSLGMAHSELESHRDENQKAVSSKRLLETETSSSSSLLENLPAELRHTLLMHMPDLRTLRALVYSSPIMHAQYYHSRDIILRACMARELDGFLVDAYGTLMSRVREVGSPRTDENITKFLQSYRGWLSDPTLRLDVNSIHPSRLRWLAGYHLAVAQPLLHAYSRWALANLGEMTLSPEFGDLVAEDDVQLSGSEEIRILQALYRYETFCHLFGRNHGKRRGGFRHHEVNEHFFCLFDPWEAEAVGCIDVFIRDKYECIFNEVKWDLDYRNPKFKLDSDVVNFDGTLDLDSEHDDYMNGTVSRGLTMTARLLAIADHEQLVAKMIRCLTHDGNLDASMKKALGSAAQNDRREISPDFPNARDRAEERRDPIAFVGDTVPPQGPPLAWALLWNGRYANIYGGYVPESLRRWGYVMWDECRWIDKELKELIALQWEASADLVNEIELDYGWNPVEQPVTEE